MNMSLLELWETMGWFARGVIVVLLFMSVYVAAVAIRKGLQLRRSRKATLEFSPLFGRALQSREFAAARELVERYEDSHLAASLRRVFASAKFRDARGDFSGAEIASVQRTAELGALEQVAQLRRGLGVLATTGATAPFVGLLGTVVGVVNAFSGMALAGGGGIAAISAGIAEALVATAIGLLVAIPAVWLYNYFTNRIEFISMELNYAAEELVDFLAGPLEPQAFERRETASEGERVVAGRPAPAY
ncbi:MAG: MotA/TolQ/ExbB proton channel family protein [Gemmatimonadota bacterium]|nr:MAG: MotA/TolQ/ExbB proton channel family protein [Gemmatimonadota bacterium]